MVGDLLDERPVAPVEGVRGGQSLGQPVFEAAGSRDGGDAVWSDAALSRLASAGHRFVR
jgi:hypothetical protein